MSDHTPLPKEALVSLLRLCLSSTTFYYNGTVYQQIFGTAMGSPVSVVVANIVMEHIEDLALSTSPVPTIFWKRYVDDVLTAVPADQVDGMLAHINSINQTSSSLLRENKDMLYQFLDVTILHNDDGSLSLLKCTVSPPTQINTSSSLPTTPQPTIGLLFPPPYSRELTSHCSTNSLV